MLYTSLIHYQVQQKFVERRIVNDAEPVLSQHAIYFIFFCLDFPFFVAIYKRTNDNLFAPCRS